MNNDGKLFSDELTYLLIYESGFKKSQCQMSIYYKCAPYGAIFVVLSYDDDCVYWYKSKATEKWFF